MQHSVGITKVLYGPATVTEDGQSSAFNVAGYIEALLFIEITAASGALDLTVEAGPEADELYPRHTIIPTYMTTGKKPPVKLSNFGSWIRLAWDVSSGGSFTFTAKFQAKT